MLNIKYIFGVIDGTLELNPTLLTDDVVTFQQNGTIQSLKAGVLVTVGNDGYVRLAVDGDLHAGFLVNDAAGYSFENVPALASGRVSAMFGGGVVDTDQVIENDIKPGNKLWIGANGKLTKVDPSTGDHVAIARTANSPDDLTVTVQY